MDAPQGSPTDQPRPLAPRLMLGLIALALVLFTKDGPGSWGDASRLATMESIAERGTLAIDDLSLIHI